MVVVRVDEAGRATVQYTPFAFGWAAAVETLAPHASRKVGALHGRTGAPGWVGREKTKGVITGEWVPGFPRQYGTPSDRLLAAAVRSVGGPVSRLRCERIEGEKADFRKAGVSCKPLWCSLRASGAGPSSGGAIAHTEFDCGGWGARARFLIGRAVSVWQTPPRLVDE